MRNRTPWSAVVTALAIATAPAFAADDRVAAMEHKFEKAKQYYAECQGVTAEDFEKIREDLRAFTDAEVMAKTLADPLRTARLMQVVNDPRTLHVMMKCSTEPVMWDTWMRGMTDYNKMMRAAMVFMDPSMYMKWMMAPMNPAMYQPFMAFMNPAYYTQWMTAAMNPTFYSPMFSLFDPNWYTPRIQWMMDPKSYEPLFGAMTIPGVAIPGVTPPTGSEAK